MLCSILEIRRRIDQPPVLRFLSQRRLRWFGHLCRLPDSHPTKAVASFDPRSVSWRRPRGAPRTRWIDVIRRDIAQLKLRWEEVPLLAVDRLRWRGVVNRVGSMPSWHELQASICRGGEAHEHFSEFNYRWL